MNNSLNYSVSFYIFFCYKDFRINLSPSIFYWQVKIIKSKADFKEFLDIII